MTLKELDQWMTDHCYNDNYGIGNRHIHEGYGLIIDTAARSFIWYYTERGNREILKYFETEQEAVAYAFDIIRSDRFANRHLAGFVKDSSKEQEILIELEKRGIKYWKDKIPYGGMNDFRTRVFVFGCDIHKVVDLQEKYTK